MICIPQHVASKYRFITLAAQRCTQLMRGAKPRLETRSHKPTTIAQEEVLAGLVDERGPEEVEILAPVPEEAVFMEGEPASPLPAE